jgi:protein subunit release factor B
VAIKIDENDVEVEYFRGSGPGGQHRNKTESGVRLTHVPTGIVVSATERRARTQNLSVAWDRLQKAVTERLRPKKKRVPTKPTRASKKRRVDAKKRQGKKKTLRRAPDRED